MQTPTIFDNYLEIVAKNSCVVADDYNEIADDLLRLVFIRVFTEKEAKEFVANFKNSLTTDGIDLTEFMAKSSKIIEDLAREFAPQMVVHSNKENDNLLIGIIIGHTMSVFHAKISKIIYNFYEMAQIMPEEVVSMELYQLLTLKSE